MRSTIPWQEASASTERGGGGPPCGAGAPRRRQPSARARLQTNTAERHDNQGGGTNTPWPRRGPTAQAAERSREAPDKQGARRGIRTLTPFRAADFESAASASSAIRAGWPGHRAPSQRSLARCRSRRLAGSCRSSSWSWLWPSCGSGTSGVTNRLWAIGPGPGPGRAPMRTRDRCHRDLPTGNETHSDPIGSEWLLEDLWGSHR